MTLKRKTYQRNPVVTEVPAACPKCSSLDRVILKTTQFPGRTMMLNGALHTGILLRRVRCLGCGQHYAVKVPIIAKSPD